MANHANHTNGTNGTNGDTVPYGQRLINVVIDEIAETDPDRTYMSVAKTLDLADGFEDISYGRFAAAVDKCAYWVEEKLGRSSTFEPLLAMLGPHDIRHALLVLACIKTGYCMFFSSPGNTVDMHVALLERLECKTVFRPEVDPQEVLDRIEKRYPLKTIPLPTTEWFFENDGHGRRRYLYNKTFEEAQDDTIAILHSSGSTGVPKLLPGKQGAYAAMDAYQLIPQYDSQNVHTICQWPGKRVFISPPFFHSAGLPIIMACSAYTGLIPVIVPSAPALSAQLVNDGIVHGNVQAVFTMPNFLLEISRDESMLSNLSKLDTLAFAGCPLPPDVAEQLNAVVHLTPIFGSTECLYLPTLVPPRHLPTNGLYYRYPPQLGHIFRRVEGAAEDGEEGQLHELVIKRDPALKRFQPVFYILPEYIEQGEFPMKDLYIRHPDPAWSEWWRCVGRTDDVLVLTDAKKFNPVLMEGIIGAHTDVAAVLCVGHMRPHITLLIEPTEARPCVTDEEKRALVDDVWPEVEHAMDIVPKGGTVRKEWVIVVPCGAEEGFKRAGGKNTPQRKGTVVRFQKQIDAIYTQKL